MPNVSKQYIISFLATLKGDKVVVSGLKQIDSTTKRVTKTTKTASKATGGYSRALAGIGKRALLTIPVWLVLRSAVMGVIRTFTDAVKAVLALEEGLARIQTVVRGSGEEVRARMLAIKGQILDTASNSSASIKELADAMYFLATASLTAEEATSAFTAVTDAMVGTGVDAKTMARAVAGIYNTMGKRILEGATVTEKMRHITDVLTFTYATQDVEMQELIAGYTKLAPFLSGLTDSFSDLVTLLGFLNTRMLRAGRTGRLTARTILQLTKNADKLASSFGIVFEPGQGISLIETISQISEQLKESTTLTFRQQQALQAVFATRGAVAPRLMIESFMDLSEAISNADEKVAGFAERMKEIRLSTVTAQAKRMKNIFAILFQEFVTGTTGANNFSDSLKDINEGLDSMKTFFNFAGTSLGYFLEQISRGIVLIERWKKETNLLTKVFSFTPVFFPQMIKHLVAISKETGVTLESFSDYVLKQQEAIDNAGILAEKDAKIVEQVKLGAEEKERIEENFQKIALDASKEREEREKHLIALMKTMGARAIDIARFRLQSVKAQEEVLQKDEFSLEVLKAQNKVIETQSSLRNNLNQKLVQHETDLLKIQGLSGSALIRAQLAIEEAVFGRIEETKQIDLMLELERELTKEREKQNSVGAESIRLWKVALRYGTSTAQTLARFLQGDISASELSKQEGRIAQRQFRGKYEGSLAGEFFSRGGGQGIPIAERPRHLQPEQITSIQQRIQQRQVTIAPTIPIDIRSIINVNIDSEIINKRIISALSKALEDKNIVKLIQQKVVEPY